VDKADESAAWRDLEAAVGDALWRYAEAVTGVRRDAAGQITEGPFAAGRVLHLARLSAIRRVRQALGAAERAEAAAAIGQGATSTRCSPTPPRWPARPPGSATGPARSPDRHSTGKGAAPGAAVTRR
jgi:hypothetical protein